MQNGDPVLCSDCYDPTDTYKQLRCTDRYSGVSSSLKWYGQSSMVGLIVHSMDGNHT